MHPLLFRDYVCSQKHTLIPLLAEVLPKLTGLYNLEEFHCRGKVSRQRKIIITVVRTENE